MLNPNRVLSKAQILFDHVWEYDFNGDAGIVESYISYLRRKIDPALHRAADPDQARFRLHAQGRQDRLTGGLTDLAYRSGEVPPWRTRPTPSPCGGAASACAGRSPASSSRSSQSDCSRRASARSRSCSNTLIINLDAMTSLTPTDVASGLIEMDVNGTDVTFSQKSDAPDTQYFVAIYDSDGSLKAEAGGDGDQTPAFPATFTLEQTQTQGTTPFSIPSEDGGAAFHASVDYYQIDGVGDLFTQMVALPLASINQVVASYIGIYSILALLVLVLGAITTRWLVTLTLPQPRAGGVHRRRHRRRRLQPPHDGHRADHDRGRPI